MVMGNPARPAAAMVLVLTGWLTAGLPLSHAIAAPKNSGPSVREVATALYAATAAAPVDFGGRSLAGLDLAGLDFKQARLSGADMTGADLTASDLSGADLSGVDLGRTTLIRTNFRGARLTGAKIVMPAVSQAFDLDRADAPVFAKADLSGARVLVRFQGADMNGVNLSRADMSPHESARFNHKMLRTALTGCNLRGADLSYADLTGVSFEFADLTGANLTGANLDRADLTKADLTDATVSQANFTGADLSGAVLTGVIGRDSARGMAD
jgi:uncharacterized protein YjbI with pentapeptide repeats